jgi:hypothetical protein
MRRSGVVREPPKTGLGVGTALVALLVLLYFRRRHWF